MRELQRIFTYFNQATTKNTCQIFLPKKSRNRSFKSKKSFDNPRHLKFEMECGTKPERAGKNKEGGEGEGKEGRFLLFFPPPPGPPHCCFFCSILLAPSPLSERLEQAICYGTLFSLLKNVATNYYQYALGLERNIPKNALKIYPENHSFFP